MGREIIKADCKIMDKNRINFLPTFTWLKHDIDYIV